MNGCPWNADELGGGNLEYDSVHQSRPPNQEMFVGAFENGLRVWHFN